MKPDKELFIDEGSIVVPTYEELECVPKSDLEELVERWREEAEPYLTQTNDPVYHLGRGLEKAANQLEAVLEE